MKTRKASRPAWQAQIEDMLEWIDGPLDPESAAEDSQKPDWVRKLDKIATENAWAALPMNRAWSKAKRLGCSVGREFVMRQWFLEQLGNGSGTEVEKLILDSARDLEVDLGPGIGEDMLKELRNCDVEDSDRNAGFARILAVAFTAPVGEAADFFEGFTSAVRKRADDDSVWTSICLRASIYSVLQNNWHAVPEQRPLQKLCNFILRRIPARIERGIRRDEHLLNAFRENVRKACNTIGLPTGTRGRPRKILA
jgi:hypothetical protein